MKSVTKRHLTAMTDLTPSETQTLVSMALQLKAQRCAGIDHRILPGRVLGLLFEKPSLRTRASFEAAMIHLGGASLFFTGQEVGLGKRESVADFARVFSSYVDVIAARTFSHELIKELTQYAHCPVINALSDYEHPCQALGDLATLREHFGELNGLKLTFVGDGNNVSRSLAIACHYVGIDFVLAAPEGYDFADEFRRDLAGLPGHGRVTTLSDPHHAVTNADVVYTDVWTSMGQEAEATERRRIFRPYQVDRTLMAKAKPTAVFLHCLPAHRGEEVTADVIDGPASLVVRQAEYRLHAQKALLAWLLEPEAAQSILTAAAL